MNHIAVSKMEFFSELYLVRVILLYIIEWHATSQLLAEGSV